MLPARLLALAFCGCLNSTLRRPLRVQPCCLHLPHLGIAAGGKRVRAGKTPLCKCTTQWMTSSANSNSAGPDLTAAPRQRAYSDKATRLETPAEVYRYLRGHWNLEKSIDYKVGGMAGTWHGTATFCPDQQATNVHHNESNGVDATHQNGAPAATEDASAGIHEKSLLLRYSDRGIFRLAGKGEGFEAGQRLVYNCGEGRGRPVRVYFVDDPAQPDALRFFHELDFTAASLPASTAVGGGDDPVGEGEARALGPDCGPRAQFEHLCVRDLYRGEVEVIGQDEFRTRWRVKGPHKDGAIDATYRRRHLEAGDGDVQ